MKRFAKLTLGLLLTTTAPVFAEPSVEVLHFWTSGGEAAALNTVRQKVLDPRRNGRIAPTGLMGHSWQDLKREARNCTDQALQVSAFGIFSADDPGAARCDPF